MASNDWKWNGEIQRTREVRYNNFEAVHLKNQQKLLKNLSDIDFYTILCFDKRNSHIINLYSIPYAIFGQLTNEIYVIVLHEWKN